MTLTEEICIRLKIARISAGYTSVAKFSETFNIPKTTYFQHENGVTALHIDLLSNYAEILGVNIKWLLTGDGYPCVMPDKARVKFIQQELEAILQESQVQEQYKDETVKIFLQQLKKKIIPLLNQKSIAALARILEVSELELLGYQSLAKQKAKWAIIKKEVFFILMNSHGSP